MTAVLWPTAIYGGLLFLRRQVIWNLISGIWLIGEERHEEWNLLCSRRGGKLWT